MLKAFFEVKSQICESMLLIDSLDIFFFFLAVETTFHRIYQENLDSSLKFTISVQLGYLVGLCFLVQILISFFFCSVIFSSMNTF